jgi:hypothetical protein
MPKISIIIPNWNGARFLGTCLKSLAKQNYQDFEVIVVDNGSSDNSVDFIKKEYPQHQVIALKENVGFARAVNIGIKATPSNLIALLNNDTEVDKNWLGEIAHAAAKYPEATFFASKMMDYKRRDIIDSCGDAMTWSGRSYKIGEGSKDSPKYCKEKYIFGACAGASAYRKEFFDKVGYFDEDFFAYMEDVDLDFRAQLLGLKCLFVPSAIVYHIGSATAGRGSGLAFRHMVRNHLFLILKNYPLAGLARHSARILYSELRLLAAARRERYLKEYFWAMKEVLFNLGLTLAKRAKIQKKTHVSLGALNQVIELNFPYKPAVKALQDILRKDR